MRLLIAEDELDLAEALSVLFEKNQFSVDVVNDGLSAYDYASGGDYDTVILDVMMPGLNGLEVLRRLRRESQVPVIMLTARDSVIDKVAGLDSGADDYITKPFAIEELLARIRTALRRRAAAPAADVLRVGPVALDPLRHIVTVNGQEVTLTGREFQLLQYMMENEDIVLSRETLLSTVWGYDYLGETNVVDVYIRYLRQKIDETHHVKTLHTIRGVGYVMKAEDSHV